MISLKKSGTSWSMSGNHSSEEEVGGWEVGLMQSPGLRLQEEEMGRVKGMKPQEHIFHQRDLIDPFLPSRDVWIPNRIMKGALRPLLSLTRLAHDFSFYLNDSHKRKSSEAHAWDSRLSSREIRKTVPSPHPLRAQEGKREVKFHEPNRKDSSPKPVWHRSLINPHPWKGAAATWASSDPISALQMRGFS